MTLFDKLLTSLNKIIRRITFSAFLSLIFIIFKSENTKLLIFDQNDLFVSYILYLIIFKIQKS